jgi:ubiquinone/menaquinone biosynthesis C-methylase UbiE
LFRFVTAIDNSERFSFTAFARHPFFTHVNQWLVERVVRPAREVIVDLGCGPGAVTRLIVERLGRESGAEVIGVDPSPSALDRARAEITTRWVRFTEGTAERLSRLVPRADVVVFLNAIHLVADKAAVLAEIRKVLRPKGRLAFNSTFFSGAYVEGQSAFWRRWVVRAAQYLRTKGIEIKHAAPATARQFLTPEQYRELCEASGFTNVKVELLKVEMTRESLADIGRFSLFIEGALPGVPLEVGSEALQVGLEQALAELKLESVPRYWLEVVAEAA